MYIKTQEYQRLKLKIEVAQNHFNNALGDDAVELETW